ncbi:tautomerase family protein [Luteibacter rhizovicinus DSM 16549]|uniref:Tautomerase family protein n=1 Tax=Luteibacter rhizovicinus DSM 16549 TaxID=1440763 RepID=A0A0G9H8W5_9GAMM|nr:tautomerase family protein [Luteibacter rhizovicinus]APG06243.1 tautomerase family protein [Luteibacter rhizovicinus DSM 16549]KLD65664.1 4-oxalocrotonate tautomerase [Luteibacter rhizovicinus DSM 16549]KLD75595.1 4-oxalocrotonate tautomerase [Xanthomonas hyacinthi DSM 19077]
MPFVRIDLLRGKDTSYRSKLGQAVYDALSSIGAPENDRFQVIAEHDPNDLIFDRTYLGIDRGDNFVAIQITFNEGRTLEQKKALYKAIVKNMGDSVGMRPQDVFINLVEIKKENWSFGNGEAQYAP